MTFPFIKILNIWAGTVDKGLSDGQLLQENLCEIEDKLAERGAVWTNPFAVHLISKLRQFFYENAQFSPNGHRLTVRCKS